MTWTPPASLAVLDARHALRSRRQLDHAGQSDERGSAPFTRMIRATRFRVHAAGRRKVFCARTSQRSRSLNCQVPQTIVAMRTARGTILCDPSDAARDYLRDSIELGLEHLAGACSAWGSGAYLPCEVSCRTAFYILQAPEARASQHQRASLLHQQKQLKAALTLAEQQELSGLGEEVSNNLEMLEGHGTLSRKILIALMVSSGALRFGQWPVAVITMS